MLVIRATSCQNASSLLSLLLHEVALAVDLGWRVAPLVMPFNRPFLSCRLSTELVTLSRTSTSLDLHPAFFRLCHGTLEFDTTAPAIAPVAQRQIPADQQNRNGQPSPGDGARFLSGSRTPFAHTLTPRHLRAVISAMRSQRLCPMPLSYY